MIYRPVWPLDTLGQSTKMILVQMGSAPRPLRIRACHYFYQTRHDPESVLTSDYIGKEDYYDVQRCGMLREREDDGESLDGLHGIDVLHMIYRKDHK